MFGKILVECRFHLEIIFIVVKGFLHAGLSGSLRVAMEVFLDVCFCMCAAEVST